MFDTPVTITKKTAAKIFIHKLHKERSTAGDVFFHIFFLKQNRIGVVNTAFCGVS